MKDPDWKYQSPYFAEKWLNIRKLIKNSEVELSSFNKGNLEKIISTNLPKKTIRGILKINFIKFLKDYALKHYKNTFAKSLIQLK
jgi:hypothetical protein